ncbi:MAG: hypothetical protein VW683_10105 [Betaproteobacteria bacterium]
MNQKKFLKGSWLWKKRGQLNMVSPFLSFATGALEAVRSRQEADFEAERKEAERQQKMEDAKALARFEFELKQKVKSAEQEFQIPGTNIKVDKGKNSSELYTNVMNAVTSSENQEEVTSMLSDPTQKAKFANYANRMINQSKGQGLFTRPVVVEGTVVKKPIENFHDFFSGQLSVNPNLSKLFRGVEQNTYMQNMKKLPKDTVAVTPDPSGRPTPITIPSEVSGAVKNYYNTLPKMTRNQSFEQAQVAKELASKIGGSYNRNAKPYEGLNKFYTAGADPRISRYLNSEYAGEGDTVNFLNAVRNPRYGFFKANEMGVMEPTADFAKLITIYAPKNAMSAPPQPGISGTQARTNFKNDAPLRKEVEAAIATQGLVNEGGATIKEYYSLVKQNPNIASGFARGFATKLFGIPATARSVVNIVSNAFSGNSVKLGNQSFDLDNNRDKENGAIAKTQARLTELSNQINKGDNVDAARAEVYEISLLYQLAAIKQGGTGGRTISDQDIENMRELIGGYGIGQDEKLEKLKTAFQHVMRVKTRNSILGMIRNGQNRAATEKLRSMANQLPYMNVAEASQQVKQKTANRPPSTVIDVKREFTSTQYSIGQFIGMFSNAVIAGTDQGRVEARTLSTQNQIRKYLQQNMRKSSAKNPFRWKVALNEENVPYMFSTTKGIKTGINLSTGREVSYTQSKGEITFSDENNQQAKSDEIVDDEGYYYIPELQKEKPPVQERSWFQNFFLGPQTTTPTPPRQTGSRAAGARPGAIQ